MASRLSPSLVHPMLKPSRTITTILRPYPRLPRTLQPFNVHRRLKHAIPPPPGPAASSSDGKTRKQLEPHYQLTFTCVPCGGRSSHTVSKQGYHNGSVLITCPQCHNRHIISDHLGIFGDRKITVEDLMRERGRLVKRGTLGEDGDVEFWPDDTVGGEQDSTDPLEELDAMADEETARRRRERQEAAAGSASQAPNATPQVLLGRRGARPSVESTSHIDPLPSTRRKYFTAPSGNVSEGKDEEGHHKNPEKLFFRKCKVGLPDARVLDEIKKKASAVHGWNLGRFAENGGPRPNERYARAKSQGLRSILEPLPRDLALPHNLAQHRKSTKAASIRFINHEHQPIPRLQTTFREWEQEEDIITQRLQLPRNTEYQMWMSPDDVRPSMRYIRPISTRLNSRMDNQELIDRWPKLEGPGIPGRLPMTPPPPEISMKTRELVDTLQRAATAPWSPSVRPVPEDAAEAEAKARARAEAKTAPKPQIPDMIIRKIPQKQMSKPSRAIVPPWERRAIFGPYGANPARSGGRKDLDVWRNPSLSTDLRKLIDWGTTGKTSGQPEGGVGA